MCFSLRNSDAPKDSEHQSEKPATAVGPTSLPSQDSAPAPAPSPSVPPDHPTLSELGSIADLSSRFRSLAARRLLAGSLTSVDTLAEVTPLT